MFRLKPAEELFPVVREKKIGILARVPLASGLLSGKLRRDSTFEPLDVPAIASTPPSAISMNYRMAPGDPDPRDPIFVD